MAITAIPANTRPTTNGFHVRIPASAMTLEGFREWAFSPEFPDNIRASFIDNEVYIEMSNEEINTHSLVKGEMFRVVANLNIELQLGQVFPDGVLVSNEEAGVSNNPDASFSSWKSLESGRVRLVPRAGEEERFKDLEGTPDWVLEVVSDSSVEKDLRRLRGAYHRAGIPEYWLVDARGDDIDFQILLHRKKGYVAAPVNNGWQKSRVFGREFRLTRKRTRLNLWEYTLDVR